MRVWVHVDWLGGPGEGVGGVGEYYWVGGYWELWKEVVLERRMRGWWGRDGRTYVGFVSVCSVVQADADEHRDVIQWT